jgi:hypothetical protein
MLFNLQLFDVVHRQHKANKNTNANKATPRLYVYGSTKCATRNHEHPNKTYNVENYRQVTTYPMDHDPSFSNKWRKLDDSYNGSREDSCKM